MMSNDIFRKKFGRVLKNYLLITGLLGGLAITSPAVVLIGLIAFVIPGIILIVSPTAFLWGLIYSVFWWLIPRKMSQKIAIPLAFLMSAGTLYLIPAFFNLQNFEKSLTAQVRPSEPIRIAGNVRIEMPDPRMDKQSLAPGGIPYSGDATFPYACGRTCIALLFIPDVTSVTVTANHDYDDSEHRTGHSKQDFSTRTYRLMAKKKCGDIDVIPDFDTEYNAFLTTLQIDESDVARWKNKFPERNCLIAEPARKNFDINLRTGTYNLPDNSENYAGEWSLKSPSTIVHYVEVRNRHNEIILRKSSYSVTLLQAPLIIEATGGIENFRFRWMKSSLKNANYEINVFQEDLRPSLYWQDADGNIR